MRKGRWRMARRLGASRATDPQPDFIRAAGHRGSGDQPLDRAGVAADRGGSRRIRIAEAIDAAPGVRICRICGRSARGLFFAHLLRPDLYPTYAFCSCRCQNAGAAIAKRNSGMIDKTDIETKALKETRRPFAEVIAELGLMPAFEGRSAGEIDRIIEACVDGFRDAMGRLALNDEIRSEIMPMLDLNHGAGFVYGRENPGAALASQLDGHLETALTAERDASPRRDYLGASRIGEPCQRRLCFEYGGTPVDSGSEFDGRILRVFEAGHRFEDMTIRWLRLAGFVLRSHKRDGSQFGFATAGGRFRGHIDGVIVDGPDLGVPYPILFEHKALGSSSWQDTVKRGVKASKPVYWAQAQVYMAYLAVAPMLFVALNRDTMWLYPELIAFDPADAQALSDRAVTVIRSVEARQLLPRVADDADYYVCRFCPYRRRCHHLDGGVA